MPSLNSVYFTTSTKLKAKACFWRFLAIVFMAFTVNTSIANEFDDDEDEPIIIYLTKIRDAEGNYLADVTKAVARSLSKSGEFKVKRYRKKSYKSGPVITVKSPELVFTAYKDGMSAKEMATAGLALVSDVGDLFGFGKEAEKARETNDKLNGPDGLLAKMSDDEALLVKMKIEVVVEDRDTGDQASRTINSENVFENKNVFKSKEIDLMQDEILIAVKKTMVEFIEDSME